MTEWPIKSLEQAGVSLIDCVHATPKAVAIGYPYVAIPQMKDGRIDFMSARRISRQDFEEWTRKAKPQKHDIVLSRRTNPGVTAPVGHECDFALGQNLVLLRADGTLVLPEFLRWLVSGPAWWEQIAKFNNVGAIFDSLRCADVPCFELPIPPKNEQKKIAALLSALDDKIELNRRMNETLEAMARGIFKDWFVDFGPTRAKMEGRAPYLASDIWSLFPERLSDFGDPIAWDRVELDGMADLNWGDTKTTKASYTKAGFVAYSATGPDGFLPKFDYDQSGVVLSAIGANCGVTWLAQGKWSCIKNTIRLIPKNNTPAEYLFLATLGADFWPKRGSAQPFISQGDARKIKVLRPSPPILSKFGVGVGPVFGKIAANKNECNSLGSLRDLLLPKLISGEIRIRDAEKLVGEAA